MWWDYHALGDGTYVQAAYPTEEIKSVMDERTFWEAFESTLAKGGFDVAFNVNQKLVRYVYIGKRALNNHPVICFALDDMPESERRALLSD